MKPRPIVQMIVSLVRLVPIVVVLVMCTYDNVYAYVDPATGSYVLQMLLAGLFASLFAIKIFWTRIKSFLRRLFRMKLKEEEDG